MAERLGRVWKAVKEGSRGLGSEKEGDGEGRRRWTGVAGLEAVESVAVVEEEAYSRPFADEDEACACRVAKASEQRVQRRRRWLTKPSQN